MADFTVLSPMTQVNRFLENLKTADAKSEHAFGDALSPLYKDHSPAVRKGGAALRSTGVKTKYKVGVKIVAQD